MSKRFNLGLYNGPFGPPSDWFDVDISAVDYTDSNGFFAIARGAGTLMVRTLKGSADIAVTVKDGDVIGPTPTTAGVVTAVRASSAVGTITVWEIT